MDQDMDIECIFAIMNPFSGNDLHKRCMCCVRMECRKEVLYRRFDTGMTEKGVDCWLVQWLKCASLTWLEYVRRMNKQMIVWR